jgi:hypothetical protein
MVPSFNLLISTILCFFFMSASDFHAALLHLYLGPIHYPTIMILGGFRSVSTSMSTYKGLAACEPEKRVAHTLYCLEWYCCTYAENRRIVPGPIWNRSAITAPTELILPDTDTKQGATPEYIGVTPLIRHWYSAATDPSSPSFRRHN